MPQSSSIMMSVSHIHEKGQSPALYNRNTTTPSAPPNGMAKLNQGSKDIPMWLRTHNRDSARPSTRRGSLEPVGEMYEWSQAEPKINKNRRRSLDTTLKTPRPSSASSRRRTAPDLNLVGATPAEVSIRSRTNVVDTLVLDSNSSPKNQFSNADNTVTNHGHSTSHAYYEQHSQASQPYRSMPTDCDDGLPGSIQPCSSNLAKQNFQPSRPKSAHHTRYRRPILESRPFEDVEVETLTLNDEITDNMERPNSPTMIGRSSTRLARPLTPPARPSITLELPESSDEEWSSDSSEGDRCREGSQSVLRVKRKHLRRKYAHDLQVELQDEGQRRGHVSVHRTHSDGSRNIPGNFQVENRSEVAERVVERYRRRAQSDVSSLEKVKHLFTDDAKDILMTSKHIASNSKPRKLRPILQRSRDTVMLGDSPQSSKRNSPDNSQLQKKNLQPMNHLGRPDQDAEFHSASPNSDQEFFRDSDSSSRSNDLNGDLLLKKSPFHSRSLPDTAVSS